MQSKFHSGKIKITDILLKVCTGTCIKKCIKFFEEKTIYIRNDVTFVILNNFKRKKTKKFRQGKWVLL